GVQRNADHAETPELLEKVLGLDAHVLAEVSNRGGLLDANDSLVLGGGRNLRLSARALRLGLLAQVTASAALVCLIEAVATLIGAAATTREGALHHFDARGGKFDDGTNLGTTILALWR